jgi:2-keto-4-pentenoate hydratase/2-oxohepta-3-ene-1,7-dioic acid hydratase in catechol pathway
VVRQGAITPIPGDYPTTEVFVKQALGLALSLPPAPALLESEVTLLAPVTRNQQFICLGANYRQHSMDSGIDPDAKRFNMVFTKAASSICAANADVVRPDVVKFLDYEIELGLVLKRDIGAACRIEDADLPDYIAALTIVNDYSARDIQIPQSQFYKGKSFRTFGPVGPYLCVLEPGDFAHSGRLRLTLKGNGQVRQQDLTVHMIYGPAETLSELSTIQDLAAGDIGAWRHANGRCAPIPCMRAHGSAPGDARSWTSKTWHDARFMVPTTIKSSP